MKRIISLLSSLMSDSFLLFLTFPYLKILQPILFKKYLSVQDKYAKLLEEFTQHIIEHGELQDEHILLQKEHTTLTKEYTQHLAHHNKRMKELVLLQKEHIELKKENTHD